MNIIFVFLPFIFLSFGIISIKADLPNGWVDPYDMGDISDSYKYTEEAQYYDGDNKKTYNCPGAKGDSKMYEQYFRRTINMLLNSVHEKTIKNNLFTGHLFLQLDREKLEILTGFANGARNIDLSEIDIILSELLSKPTHEYLQEYLETSFHKLLNNLLARESILCIIALTYCVVVYKLFHAKFLAWNIAKFLLINLFLFDFAVTTISMYQDAQIKKISDLSKYKSMPYDCDPEKMTTLQFLFKYFENEDKCEKYHEVLYKDPFWSVSPLSVFGEMFSNLIRKPAIAIGEGFGNISSKLFHAFPYPLNIILFPVLMIFFCVFTLVILSSILNIPIKMNIFHLFSVSFAENPRTDTHNMISERIVNKILDITPTRKFIEELPVADEAEALAPANRETQPKNLKTNYKLSENNELKTLDAQKCIQHPEITQTKTIVIESIDLDQQNDVENGTKTKDLGPEESDEHESLSCVKKPENGAGDTL